MTAVDLVFRRLLELLAVVKKNQCLFVVETAVTVILKLYRHVSLIMSPES